jgi:fibronectin-binding autotransporter adhesin
MVCRRRVSFCRSAATLLALAALAPLPARAAVTTYTGTFAGPIAAGDTALLNDGASVSGNVANSGTLQFNMSGSSAVANNAIISGTGLVRMTGSGTVTNLFDAQTYTGATRLENGTLLINFNDRLGNTSSGVTFDGGRLQITNSGVNSTFSTARSMSLVSAGTIDTSTLADGSYDQPAFTGVVSGTGTLTLAANGLGNGASDAYLRFGGASTYTGTTRITSGMVYASSTAAFGTSTVVLDGGGLVAPSAVTVNNALVLAGTANSVRPWSSQTMNLGGAISGTGGLQKTDNGTVNLNAANTYTGDTRILAGTLNAANYSALADTTLDMNSADAGSIGFTVAQTGTYQIAGLTGSRAINNGGDTLAIGANDASTTYSGALSGAGGLIKAGAGTLTLTGSNSYTGATTVSAGTLAIGGGGTTGSVAGDIVNNAVVTFNRSDDVTYSGTISGTGSLTKLGAGVLNLTATSAAPDTVVLDFTTNVSAGGLQAVSGTANLRIGNSGTGTLNLTGGTVTNLVGYLGFEAGSVGTATVSSGTWANSGFLAVGSDGAGTLNVTGGQVTSSAGYVGQWAGSVGTATVSSGTWANSGGLVVGYGGAGMLNVTGGRVTNSTGYVGFNPGIIGTATVSSGTWANSGNLVVGVSGSGTLNVAGGSVTNTSGTLGANAGSVGTATVSSGTWANGGDLFVGDDGTGTLNVSGGRVTNSYGWVGSNAGSIGTATVSSGTWANSAALFVGMSGTGTLNVTGGQVTNTGGYLGYNASGVGTATVSSGTWANSGDLHVGSSGTGTLNVTGGQVTNSSGVLGYNAGSIGTATVSSGTWANSGLFVGFSGTGMLYVTGGSVTNQTGYLGLFAGSVGTATVSSGTWANSGNLTVGDSGTGTLTMSGGLVTVGGTLSRGTNGTINLNAGGTLQIGTGGTTGALATNLTNDGTLVFNRSDNSTYSGTISGSGSVTKHGSGTLTLAGANTYTDLTWVREGTLVTGLANAFSASSDLTVDSGATFDRAGFAQTFTDAVVNGSVTNTGGGGLLTVTRTLSGSGVVNGNITVAGTHAPGNSPGVQTFTSDLTYLVGAAVEWELAANTASGAGTNFDQIGMPTGNLAFSGSTTLALSFNGAGSTVVWSDTFWDSNRAWAIYDLGTGTTTGFESLVLGGSLLDSLGNALLASRGEFSTSLVGQDVFLNYTVAAVPEPATLALAVVGLAGGCVLRRRRRA